MKRITPVLAGFGIPALLALYIGTAPLGGIFAGLDILADLTIDMMGRAGAVVLLLAIALALSFFIGRRTFQNERPSANPFNTTPDVPSAPVWTSSELQSSAPLPLDTHTPSNFQTKPALPEAAQYNTLPLSEQQYEPQHRQAYGHHTQPPIMQAPLSTPQANTTSVASSSVGELPAPVILVRKVREQGKDWFSDSSWLGGLPRLGETAWPHDAQGIALPFAAQIDLAELAAANPETPLPREGALAFFLGSGAVVPASDNTHEFSPPPQDLQPAFDEGGTPFPNRVNRLTRWFFPFWPVELTLLNLPKNLRNYKDAQQEAAIEEAMAVRLQGQAALRDHTFYANGVGAPVEALWWHSVIHLTDQLHEALEDSSRALEKQRNLIAEKHTLLQKLHEEGDDVDAFEAAEEEAEVLLADYAVLEEQSAALPEMIGALEQFIADREPWTLLTPEEQHIMGDILADVNERFGDLVRNHAPSSLTNLATLSLRTMMSGPPETFATMPPAMLERINLDYRLPPVYQHQMFGLPAAYGTSQGIAADDILLLQLSYDDMMEWCWPETGVFQFWISPSDAASGNWSAAKLTFQQEDMSE